MKECLNKDHKSNEYRGGIFFSRGLGIKEKRERKTEKNNTNYANLKNNYANYNKLRKNFMEY